tara:strand:- start:121 stop:780 length:660 start_codon:yes stop_codon:yes gene_type:complete
MATKIYKKGNWLIAKDSSSNNIFLKMKINTAMSLRDSSDNFAFFSDMPYAGQMGTLFMQLGQMQNWNGASDNVNYRVSLFPFSSIVDELGIAYGSADILEAYLDSILGVNNVQISSVVNPFVALSYDTNINWDSLNDNVTITLAGNGNLINPTNLVNGKSYNLIVKQDATGSRILTYGSLFKWAGGTVPTLTTTANAIDIFTFIYDGTNLYGSVVQNFS